MTAFFQSNLDLVFVIYGAAFLALGVMAGALNQNRNTGLAWPWLQAFGLTHGLYEWTDALVLNLGENPPVALARQILLLLSFLLLMEFGRRRAGQPRTRLAYFPALALLAGLAGLALQMPQLIRYGVGLPAAWLAARALWEERLHEGQSRTLLAAAALAMALYGVLTGIIVPAAEFAPARFINDQLFLGAVGIPVQVFRLLLATGLAFALWRLTLHHLSQQAPLPHLTTIPLPLRSSLSLLLLVLALGSWLTNHLGQRADDEVRQHLLDRAQAIAASLNPDPLPELTGQPDQEWSRPHRQVVRALTAVKQISPDVAQIYLYALHGDQLVFYACSMSDQPENYYPPGLPYEGELTEEDLAFFTNGVAYVTGPFRDRWGEWVCAIAPALWAEEGDQVKLALGVDVPATALRRAICLHRSLGLLLTMGLAGLVLDFFARQRRFWLATQHLAHSEAGLRGLSAELETHIEQRTADLERANQALQAEVAAHREAELKFRTLTDQLPIITYSVAMHPEPHTTFISPQVENLLGYTPEEWLARPGLWLEVVHPEDRERVRHEVEDKNLKGAPFDLEFRQVARDGTVRWFRNTARFLMDEEGRPREVHGVMLDITDQRRIEEERNRNQKLESLGLLAGGIAHDFNNILTSILGNISMLRLSGPTTEEENQDILAEAESAARRAKDLTHQLLTFAKGGAPVKNLTRLNNMLRETVSFALRGSSCRCDLQVADDLWAAEVDAGQIAQVIQNLVINAVQAMPEGGIITVRAGNLHLRDQEEPLLPEGNYLRLTVQDTGIGIPAKHLERIFDPYFTTKSKGSGLGLTTSFSIVRKHGGHLSVTSEAGRGSTFTVYLPAHQEPSASAAAPAATPAPGSTGGRILVMDDEPAIRDLMKRMLGRAGFEVTMSAHGEEALDLFAKARAEGRPFQAVILDLTIPGGLGGRDTFLRMKAQDDTLCALVSSGYSDHTLEESRALGFAGSVPKPFTTSELLTAVRAALASHPIHSS